MGLEIKISEVNADGKPMQVFMNAETGYLFINGHRTFVGGYVNVTGPHWDDDPKISIVYKRNFFRTVRSYWDSLKKLTDLTTAARFSEDDGSFYQLDLLFPKNARIAHGNYNPLSLHQTP